MILICVFPPHPIAAASATSYSKGREESPRSLNNMQPHDSHAFYVKHKWNNPKCPCFLVASSWFQLRLPIL